MASEPADLSAVQSVRSGLSIHFSGSSRDQLGDKWNELWDTDRTFWDRSLPSPALVDLIESQSTDLPQKASSSSSSSSSPHHRLRALVPGCGRGYDPAMLALHGFDAYGLDISETAVAKAKDYGEAQLKEPNAYNFGEAKPDPLDVGSVHFVKADFFKRDWEAACASSDGTTQFDLIYDYTFLCALPRDLRTEWRRRMIELLAPSGILVCLEFPLHVSRNAGGPPWGLRGVHWNLLGAGGDGILAEEDPDQDGENGDKGAFVRLSRAKPKRTYEESGAHDMLSVWALKK